MKNYQLFIDGGFVPAISKKLANSINPATGETFAAVDQAGAEDAKHALDNAWDAWQRWKSVSPAVRERVFLRAADLVESRADELREVLVDEAGSTLLKAGYEIAHTAAHMRSMAGDCRRVTGSTFWSDYDGVRSYSIRQPLGLVLSISPFNFPLLLSNKKVGWAIAAGNCVILKPSEVTPVIGLKLGEIYCEAGLPPGVLNVLPAEGADLGDVLIADKRVKKVSFTGSSRVGKLIGEACARHHTKFTLEMGGKNPLVVLADADIDYAVDAATFSNFMHQGQVCMTGSRVIVEAAVYDDFCERMATKVGGLKWGDPREPGVVVGPLIRGTQPSFIQAQVDDALTQGARLLAGGSYRENYYEPTVVADVTRDMALFGTECFGPVASLVCADDHEHALELANDTEYGLTSAVITNDLQKAQYFIDNLESGMVHVNGPTIRDEPVIPFGGVKSSGLGREGGSYSMEEFTELKWVTVQTGQQKFPF